MGVCGRILRRRGEGCVGSGDRARTTREATFMAPIALLANTLCDVPWEAMCFWGLTTMPSQVQGVPPKARRLRQFTTPFTWGSGTCHPGMAVAHVGPWHTFMLRCSQLGSRKGGGRRRAIVTRPAAAAFSPRCHPRVSAVYSSIQSPSRMSQMNSSARSTLSSPLVE